MESCRGHFPALPENSGTQVRKYPFLQAPVRRVLSGRATVLCVLVTRCVCLQLCTQEVLLLHTLSPHFSHWPQSCVSRYHPGDTLWPGADGKTSSPLVPFWCLRVRCSHLQWNLANSWLENLCQGALVTGKGQRGGQQHWQQKPRSISDLHHLISSVSISCLATTRPSGPHLPCSTLGKEGLCPTSSA